MIAAPILDAELNAHLDSIQKDGMSVFVMADGRVRGALFNGSRFVNTMRAQHNTGILETMVLGQAALCGALLIPTMKGREHVTFRYDTNGPAAGFSVEADSAGYVRGYLLQNAIPVDKPLESWDLSPFFGPGTLTLSRLQEGAREPQTGTVEIKHRNIAQDLAWYFDQSEQTKTAFNSSIMMDRQGRVTGAGGLFLQIMPQIGGHRKKGAAEDAVQSMDDEEELLARVENAFKAAPSLGQWFSENGNRNDIIYGLFREFSPAVAVERDIVFNCPCSREGFVRRIRALSGAELADIKKNGPDPLEIICHNCNSHYSIPVSEL
ncbi:MAG: Hsp33 family molecular chaperone HslO [Treponemataceae bacterium]|nr:Hsp33 family molecular chaperone HslO [Treponemataceae bacterium]